MAQPLLAGDCRRATIEESAMLKGLTTVRFQAADLAAAKAWYSEVLGVAPYFERPGYVEFRIGDYQHELGIVDSRFIGQLGGDAPPTTGPAGAVVYWHVDDVPATIERLLPKGAKPYEPLRDFGGFIVASIIDPFGNILGLMHSPHYLEVLQATSRA
jgi:predicted enzyme related to lactoylglutathione lyase